MRKQIEGSTFFIILLATFILGITFSVFFKYDVFDRDSKSSHQPHQEIRKVSFEEAHNFMKKRLSDVNQKLMGSKTVYFDGYKLYAFLSVTENGSVCISSVSELVLEVFAADCGDVNTKVEQWNNL